MPLKTNFGKYKPFEYQEYDAWKAEPTDDNYNVLMKSLKPTISSALTSYAHGDPNLTIRAQILAAQAINTYDPKRGANLKTHVYNTLKRLQRFAAQRREVVHLPENVRLDAYAVRRFNDTFREDNDRDANFDEVADGTGLSLRRIRKANRLGSEMSENKRTSETGDSLTTQKVSAHDVWQDYVYHDLDNINKKIFEWTTGYLDSPVLPKKEIARRLHITPAAVSGRINTISGRLTEVL